MELMVDVDINECVVGNDCSSSIQCVNTYGGFECCVYGFMNLNQTRTFPPGDLSACEGTSLAITSRMRFVSTLTYNLRYQRMCASSDCRK